MAPVVSASAGILGLLLVKLTALLSSEYGRLKRVRDEIIPLRCELSSMHAAVQKYIMLEDPDVQVKGWISMVRELAYDVEDCIDKYIHRLGSDRHRHRSFKKFFRRTARQLKTLGAQRRIGGEIDELKDRIKHVKELKNSYNLDDAPTCGTSNHSAIDPRLCAFFAEEAQLIGTGGPRDVLVKWMMETDSSSKHRRVLSIVGFGGLGKTTLANEVYRKIQGEFDCQVIVSVSQKPNIKKIITDVMYEVSCEFTSDIDIWDERTLITRLAKLLEDKRYLVVIDDIWSTPAWDAINCAFPKNNKSSRIIVTTRHVDVARSCCSGGDDHMHQMEALSDFQSKRLFFKRIFGSKDSCPDMLKEVSNEILKKCGGLPLAIICIAGLLANIPIVKEEWEKIKRSIGSALEKNRSLEGMSSIISLSYNYLSPNLKTCLLYLSAFPEGHVIEKHMLVKRWIAEGFISEERGQSQKDVAERYFYELINKSMVQPVDIERDGKVRACRVHGMMLEILISKSVEDNFVTMVGSGQASLAIRHGVIRRLSIQHVDHELGSTLENEDLTHVRSLTITVSSFDTKHLPSLDKFEALRVLDFAFGHDLQEYIMKGLNKLFKLKYLRFRDSGISKLPPGIVMLHDLETLDLSMTRIGYLPAGIVHLTKLQYLRTGQHCTIPNGIENMRSLRLISTFDITKSSLNAVEELGTLTGLNELHLWLKGGDGYRRHAEMLLSSLCKLSSRKLQSLYIHGRDCSLDCIDSWNTSPSFLQIFYMYGNIVFVKVPKWISPRLTSLAHLNINLTELREESLHILGELPSLLNVRLSLDTSPKEKLTIIGFSCLRKFKVFSRHGVYITFEEGAMPKLENLEMSFDVSVAKSSGFYLGIKHLPCLKVIYVRNWNEDATLSESKAAATAIREESNVHDNRPKVTIWWEPDDEDNELDNNDEEKNKEGN